MSIRRLALVLCALFALAAAPGASAGIFVGAAEDSAKSTDAVVANAKMTLARLAGYDAIRLTAIWQPGQTYPDPTTLAQLKNATGAAQLNGIRPIISVYQYGSKTTPLTKQSRIQFSRYSGFLAANLTGVTDFIIGNEPNLNRFWMPQFTKSGTSASPKAYLQLLAATYDEMKKANPKVNVIGGSVSPRGQDKARSSRQTHSPTRFITELGKAYRTSGRKKPVMDSFAFHPYLYGYQAPTATHPNATTIALNDYGKLTSLLGKAFDGTAQKGSRLPIVYDEFGYESKIPSSLESFYKDSEPASIKTLDDATMGSYYKQALELAACQPNVKGMLFFLVSDEPSHYGWQSGVYYANDTPKSFLPTVRDAAIAARNGTLGSCKVAKAK